jgi:hypothetical protein
MKQSKPTPEIQKKQLILGLIISKVILPTHENLLVFFNF